MRDAGLRGQRRVLMRKISAVVMFVTLAAAFTGGSVHAQDRTAYERRSMERLTETFASQDMNRNGRVSIDEAKDNVEFTAIFDDVDINRDGIATKAELERYLIQRFGGATAQ